MVNRQVKSLWRDAVPPRDTVLPVPAGVPHRGKGRTVSLGGRFSTMLRSSRGVAKEGGQNGMKHASVRHVVELLRRLAKIYGLDYT